MKKTAFRPTETRRVAWISLLLAVACTPQTRWIAVAGGEEPHVLLLKPDLSIADTVSLPPAEYRHAAARSVQFSHDGMTLYVADMEGPHAGRLSSIRRLDGHMLDRWDLPQGYVLQLSTLLDSPILVVSAGTAADSAPGSIYYLAMGLLSLAFSFEPCLVEPSGYATLEEIGRGYARCSNGGGAVVDIDLVQQRTVRSVPLNGNEPSETITHCGLGGIALSRTGDILLLPCSQSGQLLYLDRLTLELLDSATIGAGASQITVSPRGSRALITFPDSNAVSIVDLGNRSVRTRIRLSARPVSIAVSGDGKKGYVLTAGSRATVVSVDMRRGTIATSAVVPTGAANLSLWPGGRSPSMKWR